MADSRDNQNGRMLFTDFDASDKGRPAAVMGGGAASGFAGSAMPTLADIASTLELDFEDDGDDSAQLPFASASDQEENPKKKTTVIPRPDDAELSLDAIDEVNPKAATGVYVAPDFSAVPTWEEFTQAFTQARQHPVVPEPAAAPSAPPAAPDDNLDVLSMLADMVDPEDGEGGEDAAKTAVMAAPDIPYGGIERVDDWFSPPEGDEFDPFRRIEDWYEPPARESDPGGALDWLEQYAEELADGGDLKGKTRRIERPESPAASSDPRDTAEVHGAGRPPTDTTVDLFAGLDLEAAWQEKLSRQSRRSGDGNTMSGRTRSGDSRSIDMFDNLDLDSLWDGKNGGRDATADATVILSPDQLDSNSTLILSDDVFSAGPRPARPPADVDVLAALDSVSGESLSLADAEYSAQTRMEPRRPRAKAAPPAASEPESAPAPAIADIEDDGVDLLAALDAEREEMLGDEAPDHDVFAPVDRTDADAKLGPVVAGGNRRGSSRAGSESGEASEQVRLAAKRRLRSEDSGMFADNDDDDVDYSTAWMDKYDGEEAVAGDADGEGEEELDGDVAAATAGPAPRGLTTDDLLADIDMDELAGGADVAAPVINDSDIDTIRRGPRPGTEEMEAIVAQQAAELGGAETLDGEVEEDGPSADEVAVNPMDVFANMDDMDFSDDMDDEMRAMMEDDEDESSDSPSIDVTGFSDGELEHEELPVGLWGNVKYYARRFAYRFLPMALIERVQRMIAWRENWWFYCDLVAAIVASASLAVIISYYFWYRG